MTLVKHEGKGWYTMPGGKKVRGGPQAVQAMEKLLMGALGRAEFAKKAGLQYGGDRDLYEVAGYIQEGTEKFADYWSLYQRNEIAGRIVDMAPKTTWRNPPMAVEPDMDPEKGTDFTNAVEELASRTHLWHKMDQVDRLSRIGRYGVLLIGVPGEDASMQEEMPRLTGPEDVVYLQAYHEKAAVIKVLERDASNPRFGLPKEYEVTIDDGGTAGEEQKLRVHHSRLIHVCEDPIIGDVYGRPVLQRLLNQLFNLDKITAATAEAYWQLASRILTGTIQSGAGGEDFQMDADDLEDMEEALEEVVHDLRRYFVGKGVELKWLESTPPDPSTAANLYLMLIAAGAGIPKRILFGTETGERASQQDERQWFGTIAERQEQHAEPSIVRPFFNRLVEYNGLPRPGNVGYEIHWDPLYQASEQEESETDATRANAAKALTPIGGDPREVVEIDDDRRIRFVPSASLDAPVPAPDEGDDDGTLEEEDGQEEE